FAARYQQQFIDRLWMRGLLAVGVIYIFGVLIYLGALQVLKYQTDKVTTRAAALSGSYTNALQLKEKIKVFQEQINLKYAALDCWKTASELLPPELTLTAFSFSRGEKLTLRGEVSVEDQSQVTKYNTDLSSARVAGSLLFARVNPP